MGAGRGSGGSAAAGVRKPWPPVPARSWCSQPGTGRPAGGRSSVRGCVGALSVRGAAARCPVPVAGAVPTAGTAMGSRLRAAALCGAALALAGGTVVALRAWARLHSRVALPARSVAAADQVPGLGRGGGRSRGVEEHPRGRPGSPGSSRRGSSPGTLRQPRRRPGPRWGGGQAGAALPAFLPRGARAGWCPRDPSSLRPLCLCRRSPAGIFTFLTAEELLLCPLGPLFSLLLSPSPAKTYSCPRCPGKCGAPRFAE